MHWPSINSSMRVVYSMHALVREAMLVLNAEPDHWLVVHLPIQSVSKQPLSRLSIVASRLSWAGIA